MGIFGARWRVKVHVDRELHRWNCEECLQGESGVLGQRLIVIGLFLRHLDEPGWNQRGQETRCGHAIPRLAPGAMDQLCRRLALFRGQRAPHFVDVPDRQGAVKIGWVAAGSGHLDSGQRPDQHAKELPGALGRDALLDNGGSELLLRQDGGRFGARWWFGRAAGSSRGHDRRRCSRLGLEVAPHRERD